MLAGELGTVDFAGLAPTWGCIEEAGGCLAPAAACEQALELAGSSGP